MQQRKEKGPTRTIQETTIRCATKMVEIYQGTRNGASKQVSRETTMRPPARVAMVVRQAKAFGKGISGNRRFSPPCMPPCRPSHTASAEKGSDDAQRQIARFVHQMIAHRIEHDTNNE